MALIIKNFHHLTTYTHFILLLLHTGTIERGSRCQSWKNKTTSTLTLSFSLHLRLFVVINYTNRTLFRFFHELAICSLMLAVPSPRLNLLGTHYGVRGLHAAGSNPRRLHRQGQAHLHWAVLLSHFQHFSHHILCTCSSLTSMCDVECP